jgi:KTSC domain-containing protein
MPSAVIRSYEYCASRRELRVTFQSGRSYVYQDVPAEAYSAMKNAFSKGEFFNANIRDRYTFSREDCGASSTMKDTCDTAKSKQISSPGNAQDQTPAPLPGSAPIKTPDPTDTVRSSQADEIPKVGSQDAPGG